MTNYFPPEPDGNQIYTAESGTIVKVRKEGSNYKIAKLPKPVTGTISFIATPNAALGYRMTYDVDSTRARNDVDSGLSILQSVNPEIEIYDTDIISIKVNLEGSSSYPMTISTNDSYPLNPVEVGTVINNPATSGEYVKWYPGVGVSGTFHYIFDEGGATVLGSTLTVTPAP